MVLMAILAWPRSTSYGGLDSQRGDKLTAISQLIDRDRRGWASRGFSGLRIHAFIRPRNADGRCSVDLSRRLVPTVWLGFLGASIRAPAPMRTRRAVTAAFGTASDLSCYS